MKKLEGQKIEILEFNRKLPMKDGKYQKTLVEVGLFLGFGVEEGEEGGTYSTAIVKNSRGEVFNVYVELIRFIRKN